jgi:hypothetical protein
MAEVVVDSTVAVEAVDFVEAVSEVVADFAAEVTAAEDFAAGMEAFAEVTAGMEVTAVDGAAGAADGVAGADGEVGVGAAGASDSGLAGPMRTDILTIRIPIMDIPVITADMTHMLTAMTRTDLMRQTSLFLILTAVA